MEGHMHRQLCFECYRKWLQNSIQTRSSKRDFKQQQIRQRQCEYCLPRNTKAKRERLRHSGNSHSFCGQSIDRCF